MKYYVTYFYKKNMEIGFGSILFTTYKLIETYADIEEMKTHIEKRNNNFNVIILDYKLLKEVEEWELFIQ